MANIPGIVFQEPGGSTAQREKTPAAQEGEAEKVVETEVTAAPEAKEETPKRRRTAPRKNQQQAFPVHVVKPHPLAFERAQEIIEANGSYTKILPGDEPGTVIVR